MNLLILIYWCSSVEKSLKKKFLPWGIFWYNRENERMKHSVPTKQHSYNLINVINEAYKRNT